MMHVLVLIRYSFVTRILYHVQIPCNNQTLLVGCICRENPTFVGICSG